MQQKTTTLLTRWALVYALFYLVNLPLNSLVTEMARWAFGLDLAVPIFLGRADKAYSYGLTVLHLLLALGAAAVWSGVASKHPGPGSTPDRIIRTLIRYWLAWTLITYGLAKVLPVQFLPLDLDRLLQPIGQTSPMGLMWAFMGASRGYTMFSGALEILAGLLLFHRRTTLAASLLGLVITSHILALNLCYDLPLKLFSLHLLLACVWLLAPDLDRLLRVLSGRETGPAKCTDLVLTNPRWKRPAMAIKAVVVIFIVSTTFVGMREAAVIMASFEGPPNLRGSWRLAVGSQAPEGESWQRLIFPRLSIMATQDAEGRPTRYTAQFPSTTSNEGMFTLSDWQRPDWKATLRFRLHGDLLRLSGDWNGTPLELSLQRETQPPFPLQTRGFHWVTERPFNQ